MDAFVIEVIFGALPAPQPTSRTCRSLGDQVHRQRRIDRRRLTGVEVGELLDIGVEALPDFIDGRFHRSPALRGSLLIEL